MMSLPADFSGYWSEAAQEGANRFLQDAPDLEVRSTVKAYFKKNKNGGSFWLEIRDPTEGIRLIDIELMKEIRPITLRVRIWFYSGAINCARKHIELGSVYLGNERVGCMAVQPRKSWQTKLEKEGVAVEGERKLGTDLFN